MLASENTSRQEPVKQFRIHGWSILFKACSQSLAFPSHYIQKKKHTRFLVDLLVYIVLSWAFSFGVYNPQANYPPQQRTVHHFIMKCPQVPPPLTDSIIFLRGHLKILLQSQSLSDLVQKILPQKRNKTDQSTQSKQFLSFPCPASSPPCRAATTSSAHTHG